MLHKWQRKLTVADLYGGMQPNIITEIFHPFPTTNSWIRY